MAAGLSSTVDLAWLNSLLIVLRGRLSAIVEVRRLRAWLSRSGVCSLPDHHQRADSFMSRPSNLATAATGLSLSSLRTHTTQAASTRLSLSPLPTWR